MIPASALEAKVMDASKLEVPESKQMHRTKAGSNAVSTKWGSRKSRLGTENSPSKKPGGQHARKEKMGVRFQFQCFVYWVELPSLTASNILAYRVRDPRLLLRIIPSATLHHASTQLNSPISFHLIYRPKLSTIFRILQTALAVHFRPSRTTKLTQ
ncbi:hypothetical protein VTL71DRAFT_4420 [Oculimacula yallundae]|uniref:Uncharacterized protein n=1 Tax=Oculimacula yallundae TaxID=86028 RepID=A0ABR4C1X6_9HELO